LTTENAVAHGPAGVVEIAARPAALKEIRRLANKHAQLRANQQMKSQKEFQSRYDLA
jgi:hypothetical protein